MFADADLREIATSTIVRCYPHGLLPALSQFPPGPWLYTGALENHPVLVDRIRDTRPLWGVAGKELREVRDPRLVAKTLQRAELPYATCQTAKDAPPSDGTWLIKPLRSAGGIGVLPWTGVYPTEIKGHYFQSKVEGRSVAAVFVANSKEARLLGVTEQLLGESWGASSGFQYRGSVGPLTLPPATVAQCHRIGETLCRRFSLSGLFGIDAILTDQHMVVVEINPRFPSSVEIIERAHAWSAIQLHVAACRDQRLPNEPESITNPNKQRYFGKTILYAPRLLKIDQKLHEMLMERRGEVLRPDIADIPVADSEIQENRPVLTLFAEAPSPDGVVSRLKHRAAKMYDSLLNGSSNNTPAAGYSAESASNS